MSIVFKALPAILLISLCKKLFNASPMLRFAFVPLEPPARYIPVTSILTACFAFSSSPMRANSSCIAASSGASRINCKPRFSSRWVRAMPTSKFTIRVEFSPDVTLVRMRSVALRFSVGSITSPLHWT